MGNRFKKMDSGGGGGGGGVALKKAAKATQGSLFKRQVHTVVTPSFLLTKQSNANCATFTHVTFFWS